MASASQQHMLSPSTSGQHATQTIKLEDFLRMCKEAGIEQKTEHLVQHNQPLVTSHGLTTFVQKTQSGPQIQKIIANQPFSPTHPGTQTIKMEDILNLNSIRTQPQNHFVQQFVATNPSTGQPATQKLIVQMPASMQGNNAISPIKLSPYRSDSQRQAAYNVSKLHNYTVPHSPVLNTSNRAGSALSSANNSPMSLKTSSPGHWGLPVNKRDMDLVETNEYLESKRFRREKGGKGLRHFSMKVCEKVQKKGVTSYNEVADELVNEFSDPRSMSPSDQNYDQKNIRRRVYDALNVLMAMNIISKEKKEIRWIGLPTNSLHECQTLEVEKTRRLHRIQEKKAQLQELLLQQIAFRNVVERNKQTQRTQGPPPPNSAIHLPYIIVNTSKKTVIDCSISNDKYEYLFNFDNTFEIHDDIEVLKRMGMAFGLENGQCLPEEVQRAVKMVPKVFENYIVDLANGGTASAASLLSTTPNRGGKNRNTAPQRLSTNQSNHMYSELSHRAPSRQSSVGSYSDIAPSRANTDTSDLLSDDDDMSD